MRAPFSPISVTTASKPSPSRPDEEGGFGKIDHRAFDLAGAGIGLGHGRGQAGEGLGDGCGHRLAVRHRQRGAHDIAVGQPAQGAVPWA